MPNNEHILVVEDEEHLATGIKYNLVAEGYRVTTVGDGPSALKMLQEDPEGRRSGDPRSDAARHERLRGVRGVSGVRHGHARADPHRPHADRGPHPRLRRGGQPVSHQAVRSRRVSQPGEEPADVPQPPRAAAAKADRAACVDVRVRRGEDQFRDVRGRPSATSRCG